MAVAFLKNMLVLGFEDAVKLSIRVSQGKETSLYGDQDVKSVVDRLPAGILISIEREVAMYNIQSLAGGVSIGKSARGEGTLEIKAWYKFSSETSAEAAQHDLEDYLEGWYDATHIESQLKGEFIELTGETDIPDS